MGSFDVPRTKCPHCGKEADMATAVLNPQSPCPGDLTFCFGCSAVLKFGPSLELCEIPQDELNEICIEEPEIAMVIQRTRMSIREIRK